MRAIDADAVIARVEKDIETAGAVLDGKAPYDVGAQMMFIAREVNACLKEYLAATPTLDIAPKWISVKDRLPPYIGKKILVVNGHGNIQMLAFWKKVGNNWTWLDCDGHFNHTNDITHWMQLPKPPKEG